MKPKTQKEALIAMLKKGKPINWVKAFQLTGCSKLGTRIAEYSKLGYVFKKDKVNFKTRYGTAGYYMDYTLDLKKTPKKLIKN